MNKESRDEKKAFKPSQIFEFDELGVHMVELLAQKLEFVTCVTLSTTRLYR
jgi:hypothetical protein